MTGFRRCWTAHAAVNSDPPTVSVRVPSVAYAPTGCDRRRLSTVHNSRLGRRLSWEWKQKPIPTEVAFSWVYVMARGWWEFYRGKDVSHQAVRSTLRRRLLLSVYRRCRGCRGLKSPRFPFRPFSDVKNWIREFLKGVQCSGPIATAAGK